MLRRQGILVWAILLVSSFQLFATQSRPSYLDEPAQIRQVGQIQAGRLYPLIVFLPFTTGTSERYFDAVSDYLQIDNYIALIPQGRTERNEYLPDFMSYIAWYEARLLKDIDRAKKEFPIDEQQIYTNGYSLGGDLSWAFMIRHKELFAGALIVASRCSYPATKAQLKYLKDHKKRIVFLIGNTDSADRIRGMEAAAALSKQAGILSWYTSFLGGHVIPRSNLLYEGFDLLFGRRNNLSQQ